MSFQLELFDAYLSESEIQDRKILDIFNRCENVRRGVFARLTKTEKLIISLLEINSQLEARLEVLERLLGASEPLHKNTETQEYTNNREAGETYQSDIFEGIPK